MDESSKPPGLLRKSITSPFNLLCDALNTITIFNKDKWIDSEYRKSNKEELRSELQHVFQMQTAEFLETLLNEYGVPAGKIRSLPEALKEDRFVDST